MTEIYLNEHDKSVLVDIGWKLDRLNDHLEKLIPEMVKFNTPVTMLNQDGTADPRGITEKYGHRKTPRLPCSNCGGQGYIRHSPRAFQAHGLTERCKDCDATGFIGG